MSSVEPTLDIRELAEVWKAAKLETLSGICEVHGYQSESTIPQKAIEDAEWDAWIRLREEYGPLGYNDETEEQVKACLSLSSDQDTQTLQLTFPE